MAQENSISQELADLLVTNNFDPEYRDEGGQSSGPADANTVGAECTVVTLLVMVILVSRAWSSSHLPKA